jgi:hypothetical protein
VHGNFSLLGPRWVWELIGQKKIDVQARVFNTELVKDRWYLKRWRIKRVCHRGLNKEIAVFQRDVKIISSYFRLKGQ